MLGKQHLSNGKECDDNVEKRSNYITQWSCQTEAQKLIPEAKKTSSSFTDVTAVSQKPDTVRECSVGEKTVPTNASGWKGSGCCPFCRMPKSSKRTRLVYSRFLCPCDIDVSIKGTKATETSYRYGVDNVLDMRSTAVRESIIEDDYCGAWLRRFTVLLGLIGTSEEDSKIKSCQSTISLMKHCTDLTGTPSEDQTFQPFSNDCEISGICSMQDCLLNRNNSSRPISDCNHSQNLDPKQLSMPQLLLPKKPSPRENTASVSTLYAKLGCLKRIFTPKCIFKRPKADARTGQQMTICHTQQSHSPFTLLSFKRIGTHCKNTPPLLWNVSRDDCKPLDSPKSVHPIHVETVKKLRVALENRLLCRPAKGIDDDCIKITFPRSRTSVSENEKVLAIISSSSTESGFQDVKLACRRFHLFTSQLQNYFSHRKVLYIKRPQNGVTGRPIRRDRHRKNGQNHLEKWFHPYARQPYLKLKRGLCRLAPRQQSTNQDLSCYDREAISSIHKAFDGVKSNKEEDAECLSSSVMLTECNNSNAATNQNGSASSRDQYSGRVVHVEGDGRCLFRSLVTTLTPKLQASRRDDYGRPESKEEAEEETMKADHLRARVVQLMRDNLHFYSQLEDGVVNADQPVPLNYQRFWNRLEAMSRWNTMPGELELNAAAMALERQILVLNTDLRKITIYGLDPCPQSSPLAVRYTRLCADVGHYDAVILDKYCFQEDQRHSDHDTSLATSGRDFFTVAKQGYHKSGNTGQSSGHSRNNSDSQFQPRTDFLIYRDINKSDLTGGEINYLDAKSSNEKLKSDTYEHALICNKRQYQSLSRKSPVNGRAPVTEKGTQTSLTGDRKVVCIERRTLQGCCLRHRNSAAGHHTHLQNGTPATGIKRKHQNVNDNSKNSWKRCQSQERGGQRKMKRRRKENSSLCASDGRKVGSSHHRGKTEHVDSVYVRRRSATASIKHRSYKRKPEIERKLAQKRRLWHDSSSDVCMKCKRARLADAFAVGQCKCILCKRKVVSSAHSWLKCFLCGRVAHRECVVKLSPSLEQSGDMDDTYFLCRYCVPE